MSARGTVAPCLLLRGAIVNTWYLVGPMVHTKTYVLNYFYCEYLVLLTMVPRNSLSSTRVYSSVALSSLSLSFQFVPPPNKCMMIKLALLLRPPI